MSEQPLTTQFGPCAPWPVRWTCDVEELTDSPIVTAQAVQMATEIVWALSGRQFGICEVALRPCREECTEFPWPAGRTEFSWPGASWISPALIGGQWFNVVCDSCPGRDCSCEPISKVNLPAPVHRVIEVWIDGTPLTTGSYHTVDNRTLVRTDGGEWPRCNDLSRADDEPGAWTVIAEFGQEVPEGGAWAVGELACELLRARGGADCRLPSHITQLVRQGVTIQFPQVSELFGRRQTGLYLVDMFVMTWNPHRLTRRAKTYSVDRARPFRVDTDQ